ncbi:hypothetical protein SARC_13306 [Sphaeroforma arctica JP610]|uniref:Uncharacterized protein n=1 Tax=Sphaeroforma arctica JP610 TaxID=667725 RepID=A0A0L0FBK4_9EUKA|nr:hypothetical protein SARC_13306 [Sphaeroforma arctica JP610]KNC74137.1 hypothetical protein SARC_13306 [Sphaeroforma arctica JP610]|eukprot:XP_014148039.1 hypothetical protein SARC_13306 [Sphaeroforma arctica JP610]
MSIRRHGADPGLIDGRGKLPMHYVESRLLLLGKTIDSTSKSRFLEIYRFLQACNTTRDLGCSGALLEGASGMGMYMGADTRTQDVENLEAEDLATLLNGMVSLSLSRPETGDS